MKFLLILIVSSFIFLNPTFSQYSFDHISVNSGLSQSTVLSIYKDHRGYMWFGTRDRLNRYDARQIKIYNYSYKDPGSISCNDYIYSVFEDRQNNLWIGTVKGINRYIPETDSFEHLQNDPASAASLSDNTIYCSYQDSQGKLWFGSDKGLNMLNSPTSRIFNHFFKASPHTPGLTGNQVYAIFEDHQKNLWVGTTEGLTEMMPANGKYTFKNFAALKGAGNGLDGNFVKTIAEDKQGNICIGTETGGLNIYDPKTATFSHYKHDPFNNNSLSHNDVRKIVVDKNGTLWIGTMTGLNLLSADKKTFTLYEHDIENRNSISDNSVKDIYFDNTGTVWVGTMFGGVNIIHPNTIPFKIYQSNKFKNSISGNVVSGIVEDPKRNFWIGTEGGGLNYYDRLHDSFKHYTNKPGDAGSIATNFVKAVYRDKDNNLWVGLHQWGLDLYQPAGDNFRHFRNNPADPHSISSDIISCILQDSYNRLWVGTSKGLDLFDQQKQLFNQYITDAKHPVLLSSKWVRCIYEDSKRNIWVGTTGGLNLLKAGTSAFTWFKANERDEKSLKVGYINCIKEDNSGRIWVGSFHGGLSLYDPVTSSFKTYNSELGLPSDNVLQIQPDDQGYLWISTDNGLTRFDPKTEKFKNYTVKDGLPTNEFNYNSSFKDANGDLYFGSYNGLISFNPHQIKENATPPTVVFTGLKLFNQPVKIGDESNLLKQDISLAQSVTFTHDQNVFSLDFAALNYDKPDRNQYMYTLEGFEKRWNYVSTPTATYTNLPAGDYDFVVRGSNNDGVWNGTPTKLHIVVLPPIWKTWWAYLIYTATFAGLLILVIRFFRRQARLERDLYYEHLNFERQQEVHQMKLDFFTKVSHEIRTPLTLILAPVEKLIDMTLDNAVVSRQLTYVKQNTDRLMRLVNELLDFRKIETGHLKMNVVESDFVWFCEDIFLSFERLAASKNISYQFKSSTESIPMYFDPPQFEKVLFNILSNAFKFTPNEGTILVSVDADSDWVNVSVTDNGAGIADARQAHIFENFYQAQNSTASPGWGLGLALAKNIVEMHQGKISVESQVATDSHPGKTTFTVSLLKGKAHFNTHDLADEPDTSYVARPVASPLPALENDSSSVKEKQTLLLVEDNNELRGLIRESLMELYDIHESANGAEGWEAACELIPDLIISDVTMPVMDGLELCAKLKTDERTNHIPVILLTAKAAYVHQVSGLETGADAYITKPFQMQILELNIRNLIAARQSMQRKFAQQVTLMPKNKVIDSPDEKFLNKLMDIIETNMEDPEFGVIKLVKEIGMSQSILYRKIKALTDMNITDFIKSVRLKQAALLFAQNKLGIAEVAYAVGFNDRKYFSKEFKKQFGKAPTEYIDEANSSAI